MRYLFVCIFVLLLNLAQANPIQDKLDVFIDCNNFGSDCYPQYVRQELNTITFVRDRLDADVHILAMANWNSVGVQTNTLYIIGRKQFENQTDTLTYAIPQNSTEDETRKLWVKQLKMALLPFLLKTGLVKAIEINFPSTSEAVSDTTTEKDPYNFWVFQFGLSGSYSGNQVYKDASGNGYFFADRETNESKTNVYINASEQFTSYKDGADIYEYDYQQFGLGAAYAKKLTTHVALGGDIDFNNSIFSNLKAQFSLGPRIEYSIFPYKEFNTKRWVFQYGIEGRRNVYYDTTIYLKTQETFMAQSLSSIVSFTQKWGSINLGIFWRNLLHDWSKNNLSFNGALSFRLFKGFNMAIWGNYNFVRNQINIRKGDASIDQLLAKNREILSAYNFNSGVGFSYRFGSKFNSAVNPSFRGLNYSINF